MRYRRLSKSGDYTFGQGQENFLINSPAAVAQAVKTRLLLLTDEWFVDITDGTDYAGQVLGMHTSGTYDQEIRGRILDTQGVDSIESYSSTRSGRDLQVAATINTVYGLATVEASL